MHDYFRRVLDAVLAKTVAFRSASIIEVETHAEKLFLKAVLIVLHLVVRVSSLLEKLTQGLETLDPVSLGISPPSYDV